ncbi:MAG: hypothetical protein M4579_004808 [Chaenotheca gracillima]|nr:MAG: hypothetical protein M4579_004808 [Chaenotheca gracillima]
MAPPTKKRKKTSAVEEVTFDFGAREEYLTGFHKRKLQRAKFAQDVAAKKEREEKLEDRRKLREGRKEEARQHVETVNAMLRRAAKENESSDDETSSEYEEWDGFSDTDIADTINHEEQYVDDDRHTTVAVETIDVSRDGFRVTDDNSDSGDGDPTEASHDAEKKDSTGPAERMASNGKRIWTKEKPVKPKPKTKKKAFRYENKSERKATRAKERSGNKAKAKARRE